MADHPWAAESLERPGPTLAAVPTPLLDAALKHAEAVEHIHRDALATSEPKPVTEAASPPSRGSRATAEEAKQGPRATGEPVWTYKENASELASAAESARSICLTPAVSVVPASLGTLDWLVTQAARPPTQVMFQRAVNAMAEAIKKSAKANTNARGPIDVHAMLLALEDQEELGVSNLRLCRKVDGFGAYEGLPASTLKAGQPALLYCELPGLRYQAKDLGYVARLSSRVELVASRDNTKVWEQSLGDVEDQCQSRRRDNYANYRFALPPALPPGDYRLRLILTDLLGDQTASTELPLTVVK
jgi:hypothetical protein